MDIFPPRLQHFAQRPRKGRHGQMGGTILGFIFGLLLGLAIAVAVAMVITKAPLPYVTRPVSVQKPQQVTSPLTDPNQNLYAQQGTTAQDPRAVQTIDATQTPPPAPVTENTAEPAQIPQTSQTPVYLQTGAFENRAEAEALRAQLALRGFQASVQPYRAINIWIYRVRLGPFYDTKLVDNTRQNLQNHGINSIVMR